LCDCGDNCHVILPNCINLTEPFGSLVYVVIEKEVANGYGRIVNMASTLGSLAEIASQDSPHDAVLSPAYRLSKTLLNGITVLLAKELRDTNILVNAVCPGWVRTDLGGDQAPLTPEQGADTPVWLATLVDGGPTGGFFRERRPIPW
jgi:NAD(P)-dependent dehydrogenase (short-subunit alcohol dehydrogenase family)